MATEEGTVIKLAASTAWIKTKRSASCESCASKKSCNAMGGGNDMEVEAINMTDAGVGDQVVLSFETSSLLKATFLLYVFPILCMLAGAVIGKETAQMLNYDESVMSAIISFLFFFIAIFFVKIKGNRMALDDKYQPKIIRVIKRAIIEKTE